MSDWRLRDSTMGRALWLWWLTLQVRLGVKYRCRCGAISRPQDREKHERFHDIIREYLEAPIPTREQIQQAAAPPAPQEPTK